MIIEIISCLVSGSAVVFSVSLTMKIQKLKFEHEYSIEKKQSKIRELMTSVQALNRDLDEWNEIENHARIIDADQYPQNTVLEILKYHEREEKIN